LKAIKIESFIRGVNMINLIKKEIYIFRKYIAWVFMFPIFYFYILIAASFNKEFIYISFTVIILSLTSVIHNSIYKEDEQNKTKILMACLAIDRAKDIKSKYFVSALFPVIFSILFYLYILFIESTNASGSWQVARMGIIMDYEIILLASSISLIYIGLTMPIHYTDSKLFKALAAIPNILFLPLFIYLPALGLVFEKSINMEQILALNLLNLTKLSLIAFFLSILIYLGSMKATIKLYNKMEF